MGGGKGTSTSTTAPPKEIMDAYKQSLGYAGQAVSKPYQQYQGQLVAGMNPTQQQGISNVNAAQGAALPYIQQGASYTNQAAQGVNPQMINQFMSPYLNNVVNATQKNLLESNAQQLAGLKGQAIQSGAFGGDRSRFAQAELARQQGLAGGQVIGGLLNQGYGQAMAGAQQNVQNMLAGGQQLGSMGQAAQQSILQGAQAQLAAGAQQQATEQAFLQSAYDQFLQRQAYPYQQAQFFANIAQGIGAGAGGTTQQTPAGPSPVSQALGLITAIGSFSDERVKENIQPVGETYDGQQIYRYNYKGEPRTQIGLIAQEVEQKHPEAVGSLGGIKMVDYAAATENAAHRAGKAHGGSSMGGLVTPGMQREAFAQGGFGMVPYADFASSMSFVPTGELTYRGHSPGSTMPEGYKMADLEKMAEGSDFDTINAMSPEQIDKLKAGFGDIGQGLGLTPSNDGADGVRAPTYSGPMSGVGNFFSGIGSAFGFAHGGVVPRHGYATDGAVEGGDENVFVPPSPEEVRQYIIDAAKKSGVDPNEALRVYASEGMSGNPKENWQSKIVKDGVREESYGPFQLNMGPQGLGTAMLKNTGVDPRDPSNWQAGVDFGLAEAARGGWKPWMGAAKIGLTGAATPYDGAGSGLAGADIEQATGVIPAANTAEPAAETMAMPVSGDQDANRSIFERLTGQELSGNARRAMLAAGLAMLGGRSPYAGVNIGKGGLAGLQSYYTGLTNERETAKTGTEMAKTAAETTGLGVTQKLSLQAAWMNYNMIRAQNGKPPITFDQYKKSVGLPSEGSAGEDMGGGAGGENAPLPAETPSTGEEPAAPSGEEVSTEPPAEPEFKIGGDPNKVGTLNYWQERMRRAQDSAVYAAGDPNKIAGINQQISTAQENLNKITESPFYVAAQNMDQNYDITKTNLLRLGELNADFMGGRGSKNVADFIGLAKKLGIEDQLPAGWQDEDAKYDEALKLATEIAINDAKQSGLLKAPGAALEAEERTVPVPEMAPEARYNLVKKQLAILERNKDLYAGWDTSPDTRAYVRQFTADPEHNMEKYVKMAEELLPAPMTSGTPPVASTVVEQLNKRFPDAAEGQIVTGRGGEKLKKVGNTWVVAE